MLYISFTLCVYRIYVLYKIVASNLETLKSEKKTYEKNNPNSFFDFYYFVQ